MVRHIFRAYIEDWEKEDRFKNDCVAEARLLAKYKGLVFWDPDTDKTFHVEKNMEFRRGRSNGWFVLGVSSDQQDDSDDCEAFSLEIACELIGDTPQANGIMVIRQG